MFVSAGVVDNQLQLGLLGDFRVNAREETEALLVAVHRLTHGDGGTWSHVQGSEQDEGAMATDA